MYAEPLEYVLPTEVVECAGNTLHSSREEGTI